VTRDEFYVACVNPTETVRRKKKRAGKLKTMSSVLLVPVDEQDLSDAIGTASLKPVCLNQDGRVSQEDIESDTEDNDGDIEAVYAEEGERTTGELNLLTSVKIKSEPATEQTSSELIKKKRGRPSKKGYYVYRLMLAK
jgi:hypothetical protein